MNLNNCPILIEPLVVRYFKITLLYNLNRKNMYFSKVIVGTLKSVFLLESFPALNKRNILNVKLTGKDKKARALSIRFRTR